MIDVSTALKNPGQAFPLECALTLAPMDVMGDQVRLTDIALSGTMTGSEESVSVRGGVRAELAAHCARCLREVSRPLKAEIEEVFVRAPDPENPDQRPLEGFRIDLTGPAREALLLEMPMRLLCRKDCEGLCPVCGANLNEKPCDCPKDARRANPFAALGELFTSDDEEV
jgi:uncharacterized protein